MNTYLMRFKDNWPPRKIANPPPPGPKSNPSANQNSNPNGGSIYLGGNYPDTI